MLASNYSSSVPCSPSELPFSCLENDNNNINKRKRRPAGTPDPDAEVVSLSPKTLLESDRYVCEICNQGFQRDQNLQMHRRRHKVPWKLLKRESSQVVRKRVFVCPEPTCLHHDPCHALGDLVGIKKHFRRKHSNYKQWVCDKCYKAYAVQSDYKAHLKTCGTRGHSCDCGRVFSRVESFIEHQDTCNMGSSIRSSEPQAPPLLQPNTNACLSRTASSTLSPSSDHHTNYNPTTTTTIIPPSSSWSPSALLVLPKPKDYSSSSSTKLILKPSTENNSTSKHHNLKLQLSTSTTTSNMIISVSPPKDYQNHSNTQLQLSIGSSDFGEKVETNVIKNNRNNYSPSRDHESSTTTNDKAAVGVNYSSRLIKEEAREQLRLAMVEKSYAEEARKEAKRQIELAEQEFANAKRIRQEAQVELDKAQTMKELAIKKINSTVLLVTCHSCKQHFQAQRATLNIDDDIN